MHLTPICQPVEEVWEQRRSPCSLRVTPPPAGIKILS
jgi:hypothetical protein